MKCWVLLFTLLAGAAAGQDKNSSLTVNPVVLGGRPMPQQVSEFVALMLERGGMDRLEIGQGGAPQTDYVLSTECAGTPASGMTEVRATLADRSGKSVWSTVATPQDADWQKLGVREPMQCILLLVERLRPVLKLDDPSRADARPPGRFAQLMAERSGLPPEAERAAMQPRLDALKAARPRQLAIYAPNPERLGELVQAEGLGQVRAAAAAPELSVAPNMNEQKVLWDQARAFRDFIRQHPPDADYALYAAYLGTAMVHFVVSNRAGEWVIVDFQNDHHPDYQSIAPKSADDCARLVVKRLASYLH